MTVEASALPVSPLNPLHHRTRAEPTRRTNPEERRLTSRSHELVRDGRHHASAGRAEWMADGE
jgi:hypothetical protein